MVSKKTYLLQIFCVLLLLCACNKNSPRHTVNENLTLAATDKRPFGAYVFRQLAEQSFIDNEIENNTKTFDKWTNDLLSFDGERTNNVYIILTPALYSYKNEVQAMTDFVERGNTLFVAANYFDPGFLETFSLSQENDLTILSSPADFKIRDTRKTLADSNNFSSRNFSFTYYPLQKKLDTDSSKKIEILGYNDFGHPDMLRVKYGKGELIVMTNAAALSNYFLLTRDNYKYALAALSYMPVYNNAVIWDDFYRRNSTPGSRPPEGQSMFSSLLSIPQMRWAFWILIATLVIWFVSNLFRRQRVIPVKKPNTNSSIEFTQTIARLYFNKKDNRNIALKMIAYFQDYVRNKYYMNYTGVNEEFARTLAAKTGLPAEKTTSLVNSIYAVQHSNTTSDDSLLRLNNEIQEVLNITHSNK